MYEVSCSIEEFEIRDLIGTGLVASYPRVGLDENDLILRAYVNADSIEHSIKLFRYSFGPTVKEKALNVTRIDSQYIDSQDWLVHAIFEKAKEGEIDGRIEFKL